MGVLSGECSDGVIVFRLSGRISYATFTEGQQTALELLEGKTGAQVLVLAGNFTGWETEGDWGDLSLQSKFDSNIGRMAVVCTDGWKDRLSLFTGQGLRRFPVQFFSTQDQDAARAWLSIKV